MKSTIKPKINKIKNKLKSIYGVVGRKLRDEKIDAEEYLKKVDKKLKRILDEIA